MKKKVWMYEGKENPIWLNITVKQLNEYELMYYGYVFLGTTEIEITPEVKTVRKEVGAELIVNSGGLFRIKGHAPNNVKNIKISYEVEE